MPSSEPSRWRVAAAAGFGVVWLGLLSVYPFVLPALTAAWGVRAIAALGLVLGLLTLPLAGWLRGQGRGSRLALGLPVLLVLAGGLQSRLLLELIPAWIQLSVGIFFIESLNGGDSLIERGARWLVPEAPEFIAPYCRKVTACWGVFFVVAAGVCTLAAVTGAHELWRLACGPGLWGLVGFFTAAEFLLRKTWFRYYFHGGPFDRLWSRFFPAEATPQGRRSLEAIRRYRASRAGQSS